MMTTRELIRHLNQRRGWFSARDVTEATATNIHSVTQLLAQLLSAEFLEREIPRLRSKRSATYRRMRAIPEDFVYGRADEWSKPKQVRRTAPEQSIPRPATLAELLLTIGDE